MNELLEHIREYFNNFNNKDYKVCLSRPRETFNPRVELYSIDSNNNCIILRIELWDSYKYCLIYVHEIEEIEMKSTMLEIKKSNGKEYKFVVERKHGIYDWNGPE